MAEGVRLVLDDLAWHRSPVAGNVVTSATRSSGMPVALSAAIDCALSRTPRAACAAAEAA